MTNKHVYSSYIPVFDSSSSNNVVAVMELYSDITHLVDSARANQTGFGYCFCHARVVFGASRKCKTR